MPDEITIKPKLESTAAGAGNLSVNSTRIKLINLCALGLGVSFFLPWANFLFGSTISGFDLQKMGGEQRLLWLIPVCSGLTILAGITKRSQTNLSQLTGLLPFIVVGYWLYKLGNDLFQMLTYGGILSLIFGAGLLVLPRIMK